MDTSWVVVKVVWMDASMVVVKVENLVDSKVVR